MNIDTWIKIWRTGFAVAILGVAQFIVCSIIAMVLYPGGTIETRQTSNYRLSQNYLGDLGREVSLNNKDNETGSRIFNGSMILLGLCSIPFFLFLPTHAADRVGWLSIAAIFGVVSALLLITIASSPVDISPFAHYVALFFWVVTTFFCTSIHAGCMLTSKENPSLGLALVSVAVAMLTVSYIYHSTETAAAVMFGREIPLKSVFLQKLVFISWMIWVMVFSARSLLVTDFSEYAEHRIKKDTDDYLKELENQPWTGQRK
ncbi:MAG: DUF998 domain-containing protein [Pirellulaceae bacterium]